MTKLNDREREKLSKIMGRFGDDNENVRAIAAKLAHEFIALHGLTWLDILNLQPSKPAAPPVDHDAPVNEARWRDVGGKQGAKYGDPPYQSRQTRQIDWRDMATEVVNSNRASRWEIDFAEDLLQNWRGSLSARQMETLNKIHMEKC